MRSVSSSTSIDNRRQAAAQRAQHHVGQDPQKPHQDEQHKRLKFHKRPEAAAKDQQQKEQQKQRQHQQQEEHQPNHKHDELHPQQPPKHKQQKEE